jgi:hypothetical protein
MSRIPTEQSPPPTAEETLEQRFNRLAAIWLAETAHFSSTTDKVAHSAFREIVSMGEAVIPLVLREMEKRRGHWDLALGKITGEKPFSPDDVGKIRRIEDAWFRWAREKGYTW